MDSYTLILTRGTHVVAREAGESILAALESGQKYVTVDIDMLCDGVVNSGVHIATAHVVAIVPNADNADADDEIRFAPNVSLLRSARDARSR